MSLLVTGATGFVGRAVCSEALARNYMVKRAVRMAEATANDVFVGDINAFTDWSRALQGVDVVVHLAARVHMMQETEADPLTKFREVNVEGTKNLARQAAAAGVKRLVYMSSVKVNGEFTTTGQPFTVDHIPAPQDPYGVSKHEAEQGLRQISGETGLETVIIRPPLIYGPGVKANFESMMRWLSRGVPLPLAAATENRRSLVALDNLVDLILTCLKHPAAVSQTFLVSDGEDVSTVDLLRRMGAALGQPAQLFYMPPRLLKFGAAVLSKHDIYQRLYGSLQIDMGKTRELLAWTPPISVDEGIKRTIKRCCQ